VQESRCMRLISWILRSGSEHLDLKAVLYRQLLTRYNTGWLMFQRGLWQHCAGVFAFAPCLAPSEVFFWYQSRNLAAITTRLQTQKHKVDWDPGVQDRTPSKSNRNSSARLCSVVETNPPPPHLSLCMFYKI
jgi:hypothetical protein